MTGTAGFEVDPDEAADAAVPSRLRLLVVVAAGGSLGTLARYELGTHLRTAGSYGFPWATLLANLSGAFALGLLIGLAGRRWPRSPYLRPALGTGFLGGFTTFSTYAVESVQRLDHGHTVLAFGYLMLTLAGGLVLAGAGLAAGGRPAQR